MLELDIIRGRLSRLRLHNIKKNIESLLHKSQIDCMTNMEFLDMLLSTEIDNRDKNDFNRRLKSAQLSTDYLLDHYDYNYGGVTKPQLATLRELVWIEDAYNLILMGPSGTGKTYIASGLVYEAVKKGYRAYMVSMEELINIIKLKGISTSAMTRYNKLLRAHLVVIDDIMLFPVKGEESTGFFNLINALHERTSLIITTNKSPTDWVQTLGDEVVTTAILDRILYRCEVVKLSGTSYRIENRKTIF